MMVLLIIVLVFSMVRGEQNANGEPHEQGDSCIRTLIVATEEAHVIVIGIVKDIVTGIDDNASLVSQAIMLF